MSKIDYIRVSTGHQETARQQQIMYDYQADRIFSEMLSEANTERPQLRQAYENSTLSETLREGALLLLYINWVFTDYGMCNRTSCSPQFITKRILSKQISGKRCIRRSSIFDPLSEPAPFLQKYRPALTDSRACRIPLPYHLTAPLSYLLPTLYAFCEQ